MASVMMAGLIFTAVLCFLMGGVSSYSTGAPAATCLTRYPKHSHIMTQSSASPFGITFQPSTYRPGDTITVTISDATAKDFVGFETGGFRVVGNPLEMVGEFIKIPDEKAQTFTCVGGYRNMVTHKNNEAVTNATFEWRAPPYNAGDVKFRATVVENYETFWTNIEAILPLHGGILEAIRPPVYEAVFSQPVVTPLDFSDCGDTKACFLYPRHCEDNDCVAAVSFKFREDTKDYLVEMYADADSNPYYVGVGFSTDKKMGEDETFICAAFGAQMSVQHGYNPAKYNERLITRFVSSAEVKIEDGRIQCRFVMKPESTVTRVNQQATASSPNTILTNIGFDKSDAYYLQLAWGEVMADSNVVTLHKEMPASTYSKVHIKDIDVYRGTAFHVLVQVHAAVMIIAWTLLSGIVTVIARHYKDMMPRKRLLGTKIWFQLHRALAILVAIMTGIGLAVIFSHYGATIREQADPHAYVGLAVTVALGLQIVAGMLRPGADHKWRILFNWGHRLLGQASHILAAVSMFLAFDIDYITGDMRTFGFITLGVWVGVQIMWHIFFEIVSYILRNSEADSYELDDNKGKSGKESWIPAVLLIIYIVFLATCCTSVLCAFLLY